MDGDLALLQALQQITREDYALSLLVSKSCLDQMYGTRLHCLSNLTAKASCRTFGPPLRHKLTVEPCGAGSLDLLRQIHIGSHRQGDTRPASAIFKMAQLDDSAAGRVAGCVNVRKNHMMGAPVDAIDDGIG